MTEIRIGDQFSYFEMGYDSVLEVVRIKDPGIFDKIIFTIIKNRGQKPIGIEGNEYVQWNFQQYLAEGSFRIENLIPRFETQSKPRLELIDDSL